MREYLPILIVGAIIGLASAIFLAAYLLVKRKKEENEWDRSIPDSQIIRRLLHYATPYKKQFIVVFVVMLISIAYDLVAPVLVGNIQELVKQEGFSLEALFQMVTLYATILIISLVSMYIQTMILQ